MGIFYIWSNIVSKSLFKQRRFEWDEDSEITAYELLLIVHSVIVILLLLFYLVNVL